MSDGGVHSGWTTCEALIELGAELGVPDLVLHAFTDGRDTLPHSGAGFLATVEGWMSAAGAGRIGSVVGRYYAMDRDKRWERIQPAYDLLVHGRAAHARRVRPEAARAAYERGETDEFIKPVLVGRGGAHPSGRLGVHVQLPARPDARDHARAGRARVREIDRGGVAAVERYATMTEYVEGWPYPVAFRPEHPVGDDVERDRARAAAASCTSPRPRSTRT